MTTTDIGIPTGRLRYIARTCPITPGGGIRVYGVTKDPLILQQEYKVTVYVNSEPDHYDYEWRDVEIVEI